MHKDINGNPDVSRLDYLPITEEQKERVARIKLEVNQLMATIFNGTYCFTNNSDERRLWALARTHLETAAMYAVKAATCSNVEEVQPEPRKKGK